MAATWKSAVDGNWKTAGSWTPGAVPLSTDTVQISAIGNYTVTLDSAQAAQSLAFSAIGALFNETSRGSLNLGSGLLTVSGGNVVLNDANTMAGTIVNGGTLALGNAGALGAGYLDVNYGTLIATVNMTLSPGAVAADATHGGVTLFLSGDLTIAAAHDVTLDVTAHWELSELIDDGSNVMFGAPANDGIIVWHSDPNASSYIDAGSAGLYGTRIAGGTLQAGDDSFGFLFQSAAHTQIDAGAAIDLAGHTMGSLDGTGSLIAGSYAINGLTGGGSVVNSSDDMAVLVAQGGDFLGTVAGNIQLIVAGPLPYALVLEGANTYEGGTVVSGANTHLSIDGAGSIAHDVLLQYGGELSLDRADTYTLKIDLVSEGDSSLVKGDIGTAIIDGHGTNFDGDVFIDDGTLAIKQGDAIGTGLTTIGDLNKLIPIAPISELLGLDNFTFAGSIDLARENTVISAATGKVFSIHDAAAADWAPDGTIIGTTEDYAFIGSAGHLGTVKWSGSSTVDPTVERSLEIQYGTLQAGDSDFAASLANWNGEQRIDAGATLDLNSFGATLDRLRGEGTLTSTDPDYMASVSLGNLLNMDTERPETWFTGSILGNLQVTFTTNAKLLGISDYAGDTTLGSNGVDNYGTFTLNGDIVGTSFASFGNWTLLKHDADEVSTVDGSFYNDDDAVIDVTAGSISFTGSFVNGGLIHGVLVRSGTHYTIDANDNGQSTWFGGYADNAIKVTSLPTYFDGGGCTDTIEVAKSLTFKASTLSSVEIVKVDNGFTVNLAALATGESIQLMSKLGGKAGVVGTKGTDKIVGGAGVDTINGGLGKDVLTGGGGNDHFVFNSKIGSTNVDTITDFQRYHDIIQLDNAVMSGLGHTLGRLSNAAFYAHAGATHGHDSSDRIILNTSNGNLYYDSNGSHSGGNTLIAHLNTHVLDAGSFQIV